MPEETYIERLYRACEEAERRADRYRDLFLTTLLVLFTVVGGMIYAAH